MNSKTLFITVLLATAVLAGCSEETQTDYRIYVVRPAINDNAIMDGEPLPIECRDETVMKILCARGEYEPASFLVETDKPLEQVMVTVSPLKGAAATLPPETVDVLIAKKLLVTPAFGTEAIPFALVHDPDMWKIVNEAPQWLQKEVKMVNGVAVVGAPHTWGPVQAKMVNGVAMIGGGERTLAEYKIKMAKKQVLLKPLIDAKTLQPGDFDGRRQFWLTVHIPKDAASGTYKAQVSITARNAPATKLTLEVTVPTFELLSPKYIYSVYNPTMVQLPGTPQNLIERYNSVTQEQFKAEMRNMMAHGCTNPNIYYGPELDKNGKMDFISLDRILELREAAGMGPGGPLYIFDGAGMTIKSGKLTDEEKQKNIDIVRKVVAWIRARGYSDVYFMGLDEFTGERLRGERDSFESIRKGGGKIFVAGFEDLYDIIGDLLDMPVSVHPGMWVVDRHQMWKIDTKDFLLHSQRMLTYEMEQFLTPDMQRKIKGVHKNGFKSLMYMDPPSGIPLPYQHRRNRGLGLWKTGVEGTMTWAYVHIYSRTNRPDDPHVKANGLVDNNGGFVVRGPQGMIDKLSWEGFREGVDDARYLTTLQDAIAKAKAAGKHKRLVARTERWLGDITVDADLDAWRWEMANRTEALLKE